MNGLFQVLIKVCDIYFIPSLCIGLLIYSSCEWRHLRSVIMVRPELYNKKGRQSITRERLMVLDWCRQNKTPLSNCLWIIVSLGCLPAEGSADRTCSPDSHVYRSWIYVPCKGKTLAYRWPNVVDVGPTINQRLADQEAESACQTTPVGAHAGNGSSPISGVHIWSSAQGGGRA